MEEEEEGEEEGGRKRRRGWKRGERWALKMAALTLGAVLAAPALLTDPPPIGVAAEVSEGVVAGPTVGGARLAVVELVAHHVVGVAQLALVAIVHVLRPVGAHGQLAARGQPADQVVLVL